MTASLPSWKDASSPTPSVQIPWRSIKLLIPHRLRRKIRSKLRSRQSPTSSLATLATSCSPLDSLRSARAHRWTITDGQYIVLAMLGLFSLCIIEKPEMPVKLSIATLLLLSLVFPITQQFFLPFLPVACWLIFFYACQFIPSEWRPPIWVKVLPALENIFYGANLSNILSANQNMVLDILAWLPYGIIHFGGPVVCAIVIFVFAPPGSLPVFARAFGYANVVGVMIQVVFPCAAPWYENMYGLAPANYLIKGSPAGLARIDQLFGIDLYTSTFTASPMVFGAFPSLHSANATLEALFMSHFFPALTPLFVTYTLWLWWATMYLSHHYAVDLVGGSLLAGVVFYFAKAAYLPRIQPGKTTRWDYDYVDVGDAPADFGYDEVSLESEEWTIGSSSSLSPGYLSPSDEGSTHDFRHNEKQP